MSVPTISVLKTSLQTKHLRPGVLYDMEELLGGLRKDAPSLAATLAKKLPKAPKKVIDDIIDSEVIYSVIHQNYLNILTAAKAAYQKWMTSLTLAEEFAALQTEAHTEVNRLKKIVTSPDQKVEISRKKVAFEHEFWQELDLRLGKLDQPKKGQLAKIDLHLLTPFVSIQSEKFKGVFGDHFVPPSPSEIFEGLLKTSYSEIGMAFHTYFFEATIAVHLQIADRIASAIIRTFKLNVYYEYNLLSTSEKRLKEYLKTILEAHMVSKHKKFVDAKQTELCLRLDKLLARAEDLAIQTFKDSQNSKKNDGGLSYGEGKDLVTAFTNFFHAEFVEVASAVGFNNPSEYFVYGDMETVYQAKLERLVNEQLKATFTAKKEPYKNLFARTKQLCDTQIDRYRFEFNYLSFLPLADRSYWITKLLCHKFAIERFSDFEFSHFEWPRQAARGLLETLRSFTFDEPTLEVLSAITFACEERCFHFLHNYLKATDRRLKEGIQTGVIRDTKASLEQFFELFVLAFNFHTLFGANFDLAQAHSLLQAYCSHKVTFFPRLGHRLMGEDVPFASSQIQHVFETAILGVIQHGIENATGNRPTLHTKQMFHDFCVTSQGKVKFDVQRVRNWVDDEVLNYGLVISGFLSEESCNYLNWKRVVDQVEEMDFHGLNWEASKADALKSTGFQMVLETIRETKKENSKPSWSNYLFKGMSKLQEVAENNPFHIAFDKAKETAQLLARYVITQKNFDYRVNSILAFSLGTVVAFDFVLAVARAQSGSGPSPTGAYGPPLGESHFCLDSLFLIGGCLDKKYFLEHVHELIASPNPIVRRKIHLWFSRKDATLGTIFAAAKSSENAIGFEGISPEEIAAKLKEKVPRFREVDIEDLILFAKMKFECLDCSGFVRGHQDYKRQNDGLVYWKGLVFPPEFERIKTDDY